MKILFTAYLLNEKGLQASKMGQDTESEEFGRKGKVIIDISRIESAYETCEITMGVNLVTVFMYSGDQYSLFIDIEVLHELMNKFNFTIRN